MDKTSRIRWLGRRRRALHPEERAARMLARVKPSKTLTPVYEVRMLLRVPVDGRFSELRGSARSLEDARSRIAWLLAVDDDDRYRGGQIRHIGWK